MLSQRIVFGTKNSSPYCKQLESNFQAAIKSENDAQEYHGFEPEKQNEMNNYSPTKTKSF